MSEKRARGTGRVFQKWRTNPDGTRTKTKTWYISYYVRGANGQKEKQTESTGLESKAEAEKILRKRLNAIEEGATVGSAVERTTLGDIAKMILTDYKTNGNVSADSIERQQKHIMGSEDGKRVGFWTRSTKASTIDEAAVGEYIAHRLGQKAANNTINRELACIKRMFHLAKQVGRVSRLLDFQLLTPAKPRKGFFEDDQFYAVHRHLSADLADLIEFMYWIGWRKGEALVLEWTCIDEKLCVIRIEDSKNDEPRTIPYGNHPEILAVLLRRAAARDRLKERGIVVPYVFHRDGKPIKDFRHAWATACIKAGLGFEDRAPDTQTKNGKVKRGRVLRRVNQRIPHDFRRTAVRNFERGGLARSTAMKITGHKTESVYTRYAIVSENDIAEGLGQASRSAAKRRKQQAPSMGQLSTFRRTKREAK